jgi:hypothetical protein
VPVLDWAILPPLVPPRPSECQDPTAAITPDLMERLPASDDGDDVWYVETPALLIATVIDFVFLQAAREQPTDAVEGVTVEGIPAAVLESQQGDAEPAFPLDEPVARHIRLGATILSYSK